MTEPVLKTPEEWERLVCVEIRDEDGWRRDGKPFDEPISYDEFMTRMAASTVRGLANLRHLGADVTVTS